MRRDFFTKALVLSAAAWLTTHQPALADAPAAGVPPEIEKLLELPEDKIDVGIAALTFAHDASPNETDIQAYSRKIDQLANEVRDLQAAARAQHLPVHDGPDDTLMALREVFYNREGFKYDHSANAMDNALDLFLPGVLTRKLGICTTMPMLFMAIAQRLGLQMYVAETPQHNFLRITDSRSTWKNFEATSNGTISDAHYIEEEHIPAAAVKSGAYMRTLSRHQYLAELLSINASAWLNRGQEARAIAYYERALAIDPQSVNALVPLIHIYLHKSMKAEDDFIFLPTNDGKMLIGKYLDKSLYYRTRLSSLGVSLEDFIQEKGPADAENASH